MRLSAGALALITTVCPASPAPLGVYLGNGAAGVARLPAFTKWLGRSPDRALDFFAYDSWTSFEKDALWTCSAWRGAGRRPMVPAITLSVPLTVKGTPLADVAAGLHDSSFAAAARTMVDNGWGGAVVRLGWEFDGSWMPWAAGRDPKGYVAAYRHVVALLRSVPGAHFTFDWCFSWGPNQTAPDSVYPGDDVVDIIGMDVYTRYYSPENADPKNRWNTYSTIKYGLDWLARYAGSRHKRLSIPEWGTGEALTADGGTGGGDDSLFVTNMARYIRLHQAVYSDYWDYHASDYDSEVSDGEHPKAGAALKSLFGPVPASTDRKRVESEK